MSCTEIGAFNAPDRFVMLYGINSIGRSVSYDQSRLLEREFCVLSGQFTEEGFDGVSASIEAFAELF